MASEPSRLYDINAELQAAAAAAAAKRGGAPRGVRPIEPRVGGNLLPMPSSFGPTVAPYVSDFQVMGLPAAWRALNLIANGVASMAPLQVRKPDKITIVDPTPTVCDRPDASITTFAFWHQAVATALMRGNYLGILADFDATGYPQQVVSVPPVLCYAIYGADGMPVYYISGEEYQAYEVVHVPGFLVPGSPWGIGVVSNFRRSIGLALEEQHMAGDVYHRGSVPSGVITTDRPRQDSDQAREVQANWIEAHGSGQRKPAVLPQDWKFQPLSWSPQDAQFLQSRHFSVAEMAHMFNLDPSDLGASLAAAGGGSSGQTYSNIEQREIARVVDSYGPWMRRFEEAWSDLIPGSNVARFMPDNYLRLDADTRAKVHQLNIVTQVETTDEARYIEGKPPLPKADLVPAPTDPFESAKQEGVADAAAGLFAGSVPGEDEMPAGTTAAIGDLPAAKPGFVNIPAHSRKMPSTSTSAPAPNATPASTAAGTTPPATTGRAGLALPLKVRAMPGGFWVLTNDETLSLGGPFRSMPEAVEAVEAIARAWSPPPLVVPNLAEAEPTLIRSKPGVLTRAKSVLDEVEDSKSTTPRLDAARRARLRIFSEDDALVSAGSNGNGNGAHQ